MPVHRGLFEAAPALSAVPSLGLAGWAVVLAAVGYAAATAVWSRRAWSATRSADPGALLALRRGGAGRRLGLLVPVPLLLTLAGCAAGLSPVVAALAGSVLLGLVHLWQGVAGMLLSVALGLVMTYLYLPTGSLLFPIGLHVLINLWVTSASPSEVDRAA